MPCKKKRTVESAVLTISDTHFGKKTSSFNQYTFAGRMDNLFDRIGHIRDLLGNYDFDELVVMLLGDMVDGSGIYPSQSHHQDISNPDEQGEGLVDILAPHLCKQAAKWGKLRVECICGNHGRTGKEMHEAASWDKVFYSKLAPAIGQPELRERLNSQNKFLRKIKIRGHKYLMYHGHGIKMYQTIPWYGIQQRVSRWATSKLAPFDVSIMGHFHTFGMQPMNRITMLLSGTPITDDDWALQDLGMESTNRWWLFGVSDDRPLSWAFPMEVDKQ